MTSRAGKYLTFQLGKEEFGIGVHSVREIIGPQEITAVPQMPSYVRGVINLRGKVIPVVDLRVRFGFDPQAGTARSCIIIVDAASALTGIVVDEVFEVLSLADSEIEDAPDFGRAEANPMSWESRWRNPNRVNP